MVPMLVKGQDFMKHANGYGNPRVRLIAMTPDRKRVTWSDGPSLKGDLELSSVTEIRMGHTTQAFKRTGRFGSQNQCLSIIAKDRTLDLEAHSEAVAKNWATALQEACNFLTILSPAAYHQQQLAAQKQQKDVADARAQQLAAAEEKARRREERDQAAASIREKYGLGGSVSPRGAGGAATTRR